MWANWFANDSEASPFKASRALLFCIQSRYFPFISSSIPCSDWMQGIFYIWEFLY